MFLFFKKKPARGMPPLQLHNTLSNKLEVFEPLNGVVKMYNCGPTPYDEQHIGNLFGPVEFNVLRRALEAWGYKVKQVTNITDFGHLSSDADEGDDKMSVGLKREGLAFSMENMRTLAEKYVDIFLRDIAQLGINIKKIEFPRASDYIGEQIALIDTLEQKGYAYKTSDGMYFDTAKFIGYGKLGGIDVGALKEGARVEVNSEKKNPADFALWKFQPAGKNQTETFGWPSPWGQGFPGWHIECTAMIFTLLGRQIDIHTGGVEHIPVHHNNEIAQAEAITGKQYVRYWLHNAHITIEGKKISKSLGNTVYLHSIVDRGLDPRSLRYWFLTGHYRTPSNFTWEAIEGADTALSRLGRAYLEMPEGSKDEKFLADFYAAIADDLNTARALGLIWENIKTLNKATLREADKLLGLGVADTRAMTKLTVIETSNLPDEVQTLVEEREAARVAKDFAKADELRGSIESKGFEVKDTPEGPQLTKK